MNEQVVDHARVHETEEHYHIGISVNKEAVKNVMIALAVQAGAAALGHLAQKVIPKRR